MIINSAHESEWSGAFTLCSVLWTVVPNSSHVNACCEPKKYQGKMAISRPLIIIEILTTQENKI